MNALAWTGAIGGAVAALAGIIAAIGAWRAEITARWQARVERLRTDDARRENELHRARYAEIWEWAQAQPEGDRQTDAMRWLGQHTGIAYPQQITRDGHTSLPALRKSAAEAYDEYVKHLAAQGGRLGMGYPPYLHPGPPTADPRPA